MGYLSRLTTPYTCDYIHATSLPFVPYFLINMTLEWQPHLCTSHIAIICKVPQSRSEFPTQIQPQRPGRFSNALTKGTYW
jgi:hypothetical protein